MVRARPKPRQLRDPAPNGTHAYSGSSRSRWRAGSKRIGSGHEAGSRPVSSGDHAIRLRLRDPVGTEIERLGDQARRVGPGRVDPQRLVDDGLGPRSGVVGRGGVGLGAQAVPDGSASGAARITSQLAVAVVVSKPAPMSETTWSLSSCSVRPSVASRVSSTSARSSDARVADRRRAISSSRRASNARRDARAPFAGAPRQRVRELPEHRPVDVLARGSEPVADVVGAGGELVAEEHADDDPADGRLHARREVERLADRELVDHRGRAHRR